MKKTIRKWKKQLGFSMIELMVVLAVIGAAIATVLIYQQRAQSNNQANNVVQAQTSMVNKIRMFLGPSGTYNALSTAAVIAMNVAISPLIVNATAGTINDPWGNALTFTGNAAVAGSPTSFVITIGGTTAAIDHESCNIIASSLVNGADVVHIGLTANLTTGVLGSITQGTLNGTATAGNTAGNLKLYKAANGVPDGAALAVGCGLALPVIGLQYH